MGTDRVEQHSADVLPVAVLQAGPTELTFGPDADPAATNGLSVQSLLSALVARAALRETSQTRLKSRPNPGRRRRGRAAVAHVLLVPDLVFAAVRDVHQVIFGDLVHRPHVVLALPRAAAPPLFGRLPGGRPVHLSHRNPPRYKNSV